MTPAQFNSIKPGDRVTFAHPILGEKTLLAGTTLMKDKDGDWVVELDAFYISGHSCNGRVREGWGYYIERSELDGWMVQPRTLREELTRIWEPLLCP